MKVIENKWWGLTLKFESEEEKEIVKKYHKLLKNALEKDNNGYEKEIDDFLNISEDDFYHGRPE